MSLDVTTMKEKPLKVHIINSNTGDLDDAEGNFVIGLVGQRKEEENATTFTVIHQGSLTGVDVLMTVRALKEVVIPALLDSVQVPEERMDDLLKTLKEDPDGNS